MGFPRLSIYGPMCFMYKERHSSCLRVARQSAECLIKNLLPISFPKEKKNKNKSQTGWDFNKIESNERRTSVGAANYIVANCAASSHHPVPCQLPFSDIIFQRAVAYAPWPHFSNFRRTARLRKAVPEKRFFSPDNEIRPSIVNCAILRREQKNSFHPKERDAERSCTKPEPENVLASIITEKCEFLCRCTHTQHLTVKNLKVIMYTTHALWKRSARRKKKIT